MLGSQRPQHHSSHLERVFEATAQAVGDDFLHALCDQLCVVLGVRYAWIGHFVGDQLKSLACAKNGKPVAWEPFDLKGSPCQSLIEGESCQFQGDLTAQFPMDYFVRENRIRCYIGAPLLSQSGDLRGVLAVQHDEEFVDIDAAASLLDAFAARVSGELERIRAHRLLSTSERRLATLIGNLPGMVYRCRNDRDWTMSYVSEGSLELTGYAPADFIGNSKRTFSSIVHPDDREKQWNLAQTAVESGAAVELSYRIETAEGSEKWVWERARTVETETGESMWEGYITDITDQKEAEIALIDGEERSSGVLRTAVDAIITMDEDRIIESFNPAAEEMFGFGAEEVIGKNMSILMPPPYRDEHDDYVRNYVETGERKIIGIGREIVAQRKNGSTFPIEISVGEMRLTKGRVFTGIIRDITRRKEAHKKIRWNEEKYRSLVVASATTVWSTGADGEFETPQASWEAYTGQPWKEHRGWGRSKMYQADDFERIRLHWREALKAPEEHRLYQDNCRLWSAASAEYRYCEVRVVPVFNDDGAVVEWIGTTRDVHEKWMAEEKVRENEERLSLAFEASNDCLWDYDMVARQLVWNGPFEKIFAEGDDINAGDPVDWWTMRNHPDDRERVRSGFESAAADCGTVRWQGESRFLMTDGKYATILTRSMFVRDDDGHAVRSIGILQDISKQRAIDEALLRVSEEEKQRIGRDIHDDLCQHLFGIHCNAQMLEDELEQDGHHQEAQRVAAIVEMIGKANQRARRTAHGLAPVSLSSEGLVGALSQLARDVEAAHSIRCNFHHEAPSPVCPNNLVIQLYRIAQEALQNAIRHGEAKVISLDLRQGKGGWELRIIDDGVGLPPVIKKDGMGILTMEHRARSIGATFTLARRPDQGTEVRCTFAATSTNESES